MNSDLNHYDVSVPHVSIIMPSYNSSEFIEEAIDSIILQTFKDWDLIVVDDCSTDNTFEIIENYSHTDNRIHVYKQDSNMGPALARNRALELSLGRFIAYFDSDDVWMPRKLEMQVAHMLRENIGMCFTSYETIKADGSHRNYVHVPQCVVYEDFLKKPITCTHTVMFDTDIVDRNLLIMPNIRMRQDGATWLQVLKSGISGYGLDEVLAKNRKRKGSVSAKKLSALKYTWHLYHDIEGLNVPRAFYCQFWQVLNAIKKRIGRI